MKRIAKAAAWLILIALVALGPFLAATAPASHGELVRKSYYSWTGVLRLWKCEGWQSGNGSLTTWLNACIEKFEKRHPGVYIQVTDVSEETLRAFAGGNVNPPDMILYAPGMLDAPYSLMPMEQETPVRETLKALGMWEGTRYAVPVALGGYGLAINAQLLPQTPENWSEAAIPENNTRMAGRKRSAVQALLDAPTDSAYKSWSAALISLFAGSYAGADEEEPAPVGEGIDLGLSSLQPEETEQPAQERRALQPNALPGILPENFRTQESIYSRFTAGEIAAAPVTQREIRRLQLLSESGKAPDWRVECIGLPFTDQAALASIVAWERDDIEERQALCMGLLELMLSEEMQMKLTVSRAFAVRELPQMYQSSQGMNAMEAALNSAELLTPPAFGKEWRAYADALMDAIGAGEGTQEAYALLKQALAR